MGRMMLNCMFISLLILTCTCLVQSQNSKTDSLKQILDQTTDEEYAAFIAQEVTVTYFDTDPDSSIIYAQRAFDRSAVLDNPEIHAQSMMDLVVAYIAATQPDKAKEAILQYMPFFEEHDLQRKLAASYRNLAVVGELQNEPDTSLYYLEKCLELSRTLKDSMLIGETLYSKAFAYQEKGFLEFAMRDALEAVRIFERKEDHYNLGYAYQYLSNIANESGRIEEGIQWEEKAIESNLISESYRILSHSYHNLGTYHQELGRIEKAKSYYRLGYEYSISNAQPHAAMRAALNMAHIFEEENQADSVNHWLRIAEDNALSFNDQFTLGAIHRLRARMHIQSNELVQARREMRLAETYLPDNPKPEENQNAFKAMSELYELLGDKTRSLDYLKRTMTIRDSLYTLKRDRQVEELNLLYETEKKDAEIAILYQRAQLVKVKNNALTGGFVLLLLMGASLYYGQYQKRKREKQIAKKNREIEIQKRRELEQELEFKKKELTTKALQLAGKNEFLQSLEKEFDHLKSSVSGHLVRSTEKISRMIQIDQSDDEEWEQFGKEFTSVHKNFIESLNKEFGKFSKNELRLIALLKMNLSSKDIANILRISSDGVKKARYRLRKKMKLDSEIDIQDYLLAY